MCKLFNLMQGLQGLQGLSPDRLAPLSGHNRFQEVDRLYDPLRDVANPNHRSLLNGGMTKGSRVSQHVHHLNQQEMQTLVTVSLICRGIPL